MADNKAAPAKDNSGAGKDGDKAPAKKKNPKQLIIIAAAALLLLGGGGGAAWYFFLRPAPEPAAADASGKDKGAGKDKEKDKDKDKKDKGEAKKPFFVEFEPFTVNLRDPEKFLQIKLTYQVKAADDAEAIKELMPIIRSAVIPILGGLDPAELMTPEGKEKLCTAVAEASNKSIVGHGMDGAVETVLITHMIIQ